MNCVLRLPICGHEIYGVDRSPQDTGAWLTHVPVASVMGLPCRWLKAPLSFQTLELGWSPSGTILPIHKSCSEAECVRRSQHVTWMFPYGYHSGLLDASDRYVTENACSEKILRLPIFMEDQRTKFKKCVCIPRRLGHSWSPLLAWYHYTATSRHWDFQHWALMPRIKTLCLSVIGLPAQYSHAWVGTSHWLVLVMCLVPGTR